MGVALLKSKRIVFLLGVVILISFIFIVEQQLNKDVWDKNYTLLKKEILAIDQSIEVVNLLEVTPFEWDVVYFFEPYTPVEVIYETVGYRWEPIRETISEGMNQIVFLSDGEVVCYIYGYPSNNGFGIFYEGSSLTISDHLDFLVNRSNGITILKNR